MENHISFGLGVRGAGAALACLIAACATEPPIAHTPVEAVPVEPATEPVDAPAPMEPSAVRMRSDAPLRYVVKKGDTLWSIASHFLKDAWQWPEVWYVNTQVRNPHLIYPGDELLLVWVDGVPRVGRPEDLPPPADDTDTVAAADRVPPAGTDRVKPVARELPLEQAIYTIPLDAIRGFLRGPRFVSRNELSDAPYVVAFEEDQLMVGSDSIAYVVELDDQPQRYARYQLVRRGREYRDPDDNDVIGYEAIPVAEGDVREVGDPSTVFLTRSEMETRKGDYLLPVEDDPFALRFVPRAPERKVDGKIISVHNGLSQIGQFQIVTINRGSEHGLAPGHVLTIYQSGRTVKDPRSWYDRKVELPDLNAGTLMLFKTSRRASYGLVMVALRPIHVLDKVEQPVPSLQ